MTDTRASSDPPDGDPLGPFLGAAIGALDDEIREARKQDANDIDLHDGRLIESGVERQLFRFSTEARVGFPPETPVRVHAAERAEAISGVIVGVEDFAVILDMELGLADAVPRAVMRMDVAFVLVALKERLEAALSDPDSCGPLPRVVCGLDAPVAAPVPDSSSKTFEDELNASQRQALRECMGTSVQFVWGPPGTGKTRTLGHLVAALAEAGERVLVIAHANTAVDTAMLSALSAFGDSPLIDEGKVVRVGTPQSDALRARSDVLLRGIAARNLPDVALALENLDLHQAALLEDVRKGSQRDARLALSKIRRQRKKVVEALREEEGRVLAEARVVATTSAKSCLDKRIWSTPADAVLVDEASMLGLAPSIAASLMATRRVAFFGDFRQLPPVVLANSARAKTMLVRDAFAASGAQAEIDAGRDTPLIEMLDTQYRMTRPVAGVVNEMAYGGRLKTHRRDLGDRAGPWKGASLVLVDTSGFGTRVVRDVDGEGRPASRANPAQALLSIALSLGLAANGRSVAVMSPYRAQARLLATACNEAAGDNPRVATVHRFQGAEADRVLVDLVEADPMTGTSPLTGSDRDLSLRLLNVALSRARDRVFVVADCQFFEEALPKSSPVRSALDAMTEHGQVVAADAFLGALIDPVRWHPDANGALIELISGVGGQIILSIPEGLPEVAQPLAEAVASALASVTVHAPLDVAEVFEDGPADIRLDPLAGGLFAVGEDRVLLGVGHPAHGALEIRGHRTAGVFRRLLAPDQVAPGDTGSE